MEFAIVNGQRRAPERGLAGNCPGCEGPMVARCGEIKVHHWAHSGKRDCDPWWENETEWHRDWKSKFPSEWREVHHPAENGKCHRADVKTPGGWVLEFQHSNIASEDRRARNKFYPKLVWVVNGIRLKRDRNHFFSSLKVAGSVNNQMIRRVCDVVSDNGALLRDWTNDSAPVFFDFHEEDVLWCLLPRRTDGGGIVVELSRQAFTAQHQPMINSPSDNFGELIEFLRTANSGGDLIQRFHHLKRAEERRKQDVADEARRKNPYFNHRGRTRL